MYFKIGLSKIIKFNNNISYPNFLNLFYYPNFIFNFKIVFLSLYIYVLNIIKSYSGIKLSTIIGYFISLSKVFWILYFNI